MLRNNWLLLHDNTPAYRSVLVQEELARQQVTVLQHPPYSLYLTACDFCLFHRMIAFLRGRKFHLAEDLMAATREAVRDLPANTFQRWFQQHTLAYVHSGQRRLLSWRMWIYLSVRRVTRHLVKHPGSCECLLSRQQSQTLMSVVV